MLMVRWLVFGLFVMISCVFDVIVVVKVRFRVFGFLGLGNGMVGKLGLGCICDFIVIGWVKWVFVKMVVVVF